MADRSSLARILDEVAAGHFPVADGAVRLLPQPDDRTAAVLAFTAHSVIVADVDEGWVREQLAPDDLSASLSAPFVTALAERTRRRVGVIDLVAVADPLDAEGAELAGIAELGLAVVADTDHPRVSRARRYRDEVTVWAVGGGSADAVLTLGRGLAGRLEASVEVAPALRGRGLGRSLALAARAYAEEPVWAQIAPGNAASVRAFLAAGFRPVGAETLLVRHTQA